jgi:hypothetical protein
MKVDGQRVPGAVRRDFGVQDEVLEVDFAEGLDGVRDPSQEPWHIVLALTSGVSQAEVLCDPCCPFVHWSGLLHAHRFVPR